MSKGKPTEKGKRVVPGNSSVEDHIYYCKHKSCRRETAHTRHFINNKWTKWTCGECGRCKGFFG